LGKAARAEGGCSPLAGFAGRAGARRALHSIPEPGMTFSIYDASAPIFVNML
jgi:hypothetical protein